MRIIILLIVSQFSDRTLILVYQSIEHLKPIFSGPSSAHYLNDNRHVTLLCVWVIYRLVLLLTIDGLHFQLHLIRFAVDSPLGRCYQFYLVAFRNISSLIRSVYLI
jgi:hypothetical protein